MPPLTPSDPSPPSFRNLSILEVVARESRPLTATEINTVLGLPKPTIHRLVASLEAEGWLVRDLDGRSYLPGARMRAMMLGVMRSGRHLLPRHEVLIRLHEGLGETCNISIPDGGSMLYVDRVETQAPLRIDLKVGSRVPLHATASGKMALAQLDPRELERFLSSAALKAHTAHTITDRAALRSEIDAIRARGYSTDSEELIDGMIAVAVPVMDRSGVFCATVSFHAPRQRLTLEAGLEHLPALRAAALELGEIMDQNGGPAGG